MASAESPYPHHPIASSPPWTPPRHMPGHPNPKPCLLYRSKAAVCLQTLLEFHCDFSRILSIGSDLSLTSRNFSSDSRPAQLCGSSFSNRHSNSAECKVGFCKSEEISSIYVSGDGDESFELIAHPVFVAQF